MSMQLMLDKNPAHYLKQPSTTTKVTICAIHGDTLLADNQCFQCNKKLNLKNWIVVSLQQCTLCRSLIPTTLHCFDCWRCTHCGRLSRLPGWCNFCTKDNVFNSNILRKLQREQPNWIFTFLLDPTFDFITSNTTRSCERHLLQLTLDYL
jgi:hypothetical protein